jgi:TolA-binding protein
MKKIFSFPVLALILTIFLSNSLILTSRLFAEEAKTVSALTQRVKAAKTQNDLFNALRELSGQYYNDNKYNEFIKFIESSRKKKFLQVWDYYSALTRYLELKYLDDSQRWDEYFSQGTKYRQEMEEKADSVVKATKPEDPLNLYAKLLLWRYSKDQQDGSNEAKLTDLLKSVLEYAPKASDIIVIKETADQLLAYDEKRNARKLYNIYVDKLNSTAVSDEELKALAQKFFDQGNLELSESVYDIYLERIKNYDKAKQIAILTEIAKLFVYRDEGANDPAYAEKIFTMLEKIGGEEAFDEELMYLRGINLEKSREYEKAKDLYTGLLKRFPQTAYAEELIFRLGLIETYILRDVTKGKDYFQKLADKEALSPQVIAGLYQLGLLNQWEGNNPKAKEIYELLLSRAKNDFSDITQLTQARLKEIQGQGQIENNLKTFLDVSLAKDYANYDGAKIELRSLPYQLKKNQDTQVSSLFQLPGTGCFQVEVNYLWSGNLGTAQPTDQDTGFSTKYEAPGIKVVNLVVISPSGVVDRNLDIIKVN